MLLFFLKQAFTISLDSVTMSSRWPWTAIMNHDPPASAFLVHDDSQAPLFLTHAFIHYAQRGPCFIRLKFGYSFIVTWMKINQQSRQARSVSIWPEEGDREEGERKPCSIWVRLAWRSGTGETNCHREREVAAGKAWESSGYKIQEQAYVGSHHHLKERNRGE